MSQVCAVLLVTALLCATACRQQQLDDLLAQHAIQQPWPLDSTELLDGVAHLCLHTVRTLQLTLSESSSRYCFTRWLQQHMGPARKKHRALDKQLQRQRTSMTGLVRELLLWVQELQRSARHLLPGTGQTAEDASMDALSSVGLHAGEFASVGCKLQTTHVTTWCDAYRACRSIITGNCCCSSRGRRDQHSAAAAVAFSSYRTACPGCHARALDGKKLSRLHASPDLALRFFLCCVGRLITGADWPTRSSTTAAASSAPVSPVSAILQELCTGVLPWEQQQQQQPSAAVLPFVKRRMALNALKLRAADTEQTLVLFEADSLIHSYNSSLEAVDAALSVNAGKQQAVAAQLQSWLEPHDAHSQGEAPEASQHDSQRQQQQQRPPLTDLLQQQRYLAGQQYLLQQRRDDLCVLLGREQAAHAALQDSNGT